ncbi:MAG: hypothetical protein EOP24_36430 [Hyphomicrobiales bacterium]|nr:MAG: hypothetical protein EOP24_36430 [Hyphomicrobiales bacterium]
MTNRGFRRDEVEAHFPVKWYSKATAFEASIQSRLGIGAGGDGTDALVLLSRIQAGKAMESVDTMFKELVLDEPETFEYADTAVAAFTDTEAAYLASEEAFGKREKLEPITALHEAITADDTRIYALESIGPELAASEPSVLRTWLRRTEMQQVEAVIDDNRARCDRLEQQRGEVKREISTLSDRLEVCTASIAREGKDLESLTVQLALARTTAARVSDDRGMFDEGTRALGLTLNSPDDFAAARAAAEQFLADAEQTRTRFEQQRTEPMRQMFAAKDRIAELERDHAQIARSKGRMLPHLLKAREVIIEHTGLAVEDLPFVGELLDIAPVHTRWRDAAEATLAGVTRIMLVDEHRLDEFSAAIDGLQMQRLTYQGVPVGADITGAPRAGHVSEILRFAADSPFIGWVHHRICAADIDALRVEDPRQLGGDTLKVTPAGQTRRGRRGAAGTDRMARVIGFSNESRLAEIEEELEEHREVLADAENADTALQNQLVRLTTIITAHTKVIESRWEYLDIESATQTVDTLESAIRDVENDNPILKQLRTEKRDLDNKIAAANHQVGDIGARITSLTDTFDELANHQGELLQTESMDVPVTDEQGDLLSGIYTEVTDGTDRAYDISQFALIRNTVRKQVRQLLEQARKERAASIAQITGIFSSYNAVWNDDPNRGDDYDSYQQFAGILEQITTDEVYRLRDVWRKSMDEQAVTHLIQLKTAYDEAHDRIEERLEPIRRILATLPFGERHHRIAIERDRLLIDEVAELRSRIEALTSELAAQRTADEYVTRYHQLREVIDQIRKPEPGAGGGARRRRLLNVNEHIHITAVEFDPDDPERTELKRYDLLAPFSGGERQEFVAFMSAASLRYRLGDTFHEHPRFAPVILDEAFIKANGDFARRGVDAWTELGFQLVIAAPQDKVTGVEKLMDQRKCITKNSDDRSYISDYLSLDAHS